MTASSRRSSSTGDLRGHGGPRCPDLPEPAPSASPDAGTPGGGRARGCRARAALSGPGCSGVHFRVRAQQISEKRIRRGSAADKTRPARAGGSPLRLGARPAGRAAARARSRARSAETSPPKRGHLLDQAGGHEGVLRAGGQEDGLDAGERRRSSGPSAARSRSRWPRAGPSRWPGCRARAEVGQQPGEARRPRTLAKPAQASLEHLDPLLGGEQPALGRR